MWHHVDLRRDAEKGTLVAREGTYKIMWTEKDTLGWMENPHGGKKG